MNVSLLGMQLLLQIGSTVPLPAPFPVMDALRSLEVRSSNDGRDGFQMTLAVGRDAPLDPSLIASGLLEPPNRVVITLIMGGIPEVLIDGVITHVQYTGTETSGDSTLHVTGEDLSVMMDLEEQNRTFELRPDSVIVLELLQPYIARFGLVPQITPTPEVPLPTGRLPSQQGTDLSHINHLARRNGFVFFVEPLAPGVSRVYFGPDAPAGLPQPAINVGFSSHRASDGALQGSYDALGPVTPAVAVVEPNTGAEITIPIPEVTSIPPTLRPAQSLRRSISRQTAGLNPTQAALAGLATAAQSGDPIRLTGEIDGVRYGNVLRSRGQVHVRGLGLHWDGPYGVKEVTHRIRIGEYKQSFTLKRSGFVPLVPLVRP